MRLLQTICITLLLIPSGMKAQDISASFPNRWNKDSDTIFSNQVTRLKIDNLPFGATMKLSQGKIIVDKSKAPSHFLPDSDNLVTGYDNSGGLILIEPKNYTGNTDTLSIRKDGTLLFTRVYHIVKRDSLRISLTEDGEKYSTNGKCRIKISLDKLMAGAELNITPGEYGYKIVAVEAMAILPTRGALLGPTFITTSGNLLNLVNTFRRSMHYTPKKGDRIFLENVMAKCSACDMERGVVFKSLAIILE